MLTFISCAKTMSLVESSLQQQITVPKYGEEASKLAMELSQFTTEDLSELLKINAAIANENYLRYKEFTTSKEYLYPALLAYTGAVFKRIDASSFDAEDWNYAQEHLFITSFLYCLLRQLDGISLYRLEGDIILPSIGKNMFDYWKPLLTDYFIACIQACGGILLNLASSEMKRLFDWKKVERSVRVITPDFKVDKGGKLKTIVIYAKMCRGEITRFVLKNRIEKVEDLKAFTWEGFHWSESHSNGDNWTFISTE